MTKGSTVWLALLFAFGSIPVFVSPDVMRVAASLASSTGSAQPYFLLSHAPLLYIWTPIVFASGCLLLLSPGLLLSLALDFAESAGAWIVSALALSVATLSVITAIAQSLSRNTISGRPFAALVIGWTAICFCFLLLRLRRREPPSWPLSERYSRWTVLSLVLVPLLLLVLLAPKFHWENFTGDGHHLFESARLLAFQPVPFWNSAAGSYAGYPSVSSMLSLYPLSWFIRLFGETEASARLPFLLYLAALYSALIAIAEHGMRVALGVVERCLLWLAVAVYAIVVSFSAGYSPYSADITCPAARETLFMACYLGFVFSFISRKRGFVVLFTVLCFLCLPTSSLLIGLWLLAVALVWRPRPWPEFRWAASTLILCAAVSALIPAMLAAVGLPGPGTELDLREMVFLRFRYIQWSHWQRVLYAVVPGGILPVLALLMWRRQDQVARAITLVTLGYFCFFYFQARVALHHFIPVMLLPLIVFWRVALGVQRKALILACVAAAGIVALLFSLPRDARPDVSARYIGSRIEDRTAGSDGFDQSVFHRAEILHDLFPYDWHASVPEKRYGGSPMVWYYYSHRSKGKRREINYLLLPAGANPPPGAQLIASEDGAAVYVLDVRAWRRDSVLRPHSPSGNSLYAVPRWMLFGGPPPAGEPRLLRARAVVERISPNVVPMIKRMFGRH